MLTGVPGRGVSRDYLGGPQVIGGGQIKGVLSLRNVHSYTGMAVNDVDQAWL